MACAAYDHESECWIYNGVQQTWTQTGQLNIDRYLGGIIEYKGSGFESNIDIFVDFLRWLIRTQENSVLAVAGIYDNGASTEVFRNIF